MHASGKTLVEIGFSMVARPRAGLGLSEFKDRWLGAAPFNKILDYGDDEPGGRELLVGKETCRVVGYSLEAALGPAAKEFAASMTLEQMAAHMKQSGMDVRGIDPARKLVLVSEIVEK